MRRVQNLLRLLRLQPGPEAGWDVAAVTERLLASADLNGDGTLDYLEFQRWYLTSFLQEVWPLCTPRRRGGLELQVDGDKLDGGVFVLDR